MLATGVMAGFGFFFWLIVARLFSTTNIGLATTLISVMNMIAMLSLVGFDSSFVRFLPSSTNKNDKLNTGFIIVGIVAAILASGFIYLVDTLSPSLHFIKSTPLSSFFFIFFCVMTALNILTDAVFLSERKTKYTLVINTIFSGVRLLLPFVFIEWGAVGIFTAVALSQTIGLILSIGAMMYWFNYRPQFKIHMGVLERMRGYSLGNYMAGIINLLPPTILPIFITNYFGPEQAAFYYIIMMIGNLLYSIPWATTKSLFAEGAHAEHLLREHTIKSTKIIAAFTLLPMLILFFFGDQLLLVFGKSYSDEGFGFLRLIVLSVIPVSTYSILGSYFKVKKDSRWQIVVNIFYAATIISASYLLMEYGLVGVGYAWILGNLIASIVGVLILILY